MRDDSAELWGVEDDEAYMKALAWLFLAFLLLVILVVPYQTIAGAFSDWDKAGVLDQFLFRYPTLINWRSLTSAQNTYGQYVGRWAVNTLRIALLAGLGHALLSVSMGYAFARWRFPGRALLMQVSTAQMVVPASVMFLPTYVIMYKLGLHGWPGLVLPAWFSGATAMMTCQYARGMASDVMDAAKVDGCSEWQALWHVGLPLLKPLLISSFVGAAYGAVSNLLWCNVMLKLPDEWTLAQGAMQMVAILQGQMGTQYRFGMVCSMGVLVVAPWVLLYAWAQKHVEQGLEELFRE